MPVPDGHSLVKNESKKWQKELIPLILNSPSRRLKWWSGNDLHTVWCLFSRGPSSLCFATLRLQCKSQSYPLLLLVICSLDVELKKSPWAGLFPQHSPTHRRIHATHTHTHRLLQAHLFFSDPDTTHARTFLTYGLSIFLEMFFTLHAWRDFRVEVVPDCPSLAHYMFQKTRLESCAGERGTYSIIQALMESSGHACTSS